MPRLFALLFLTLFAPASNAAILDPWPDQFAVLFQETYVDTILATATMPEAEARETAQTGISASNAVHTSLLVFYALAFSALAMFGENRRRTVRRYAPLAAVAMSRIRCTMARRPLDRWADR